MRDYSHLKKYQFQAKDPKVAIPFLREYGEKKMKEKVDEGWTISEAEKAAIGSIMEQTGYSWVTAKNILKYGRTTK